MLIDSSQKKMKRAVETTGNSLNSDFLKRDSISFNTKTVTLLAEIKIYNQTDYKFKKKT